MSQEDPGRDEDTQFHVSLCHPIHIKIGEHTLPVFAFDGTESITIHGGQAIRFDVNAMYVTVAPPTTLIKACRRAIRITITVPYHNLAGVAPQPFEKQR